MRKWILRILLVIFLATGIISGGAVMQINSQYDASRELIEALKSDSGKEESVLLENSDLSHAGDDEGRMDSLNHQNRKTEIENGIGNSGDMTGKPMDNHFLLRLNEMNPDCIAWITIGGTRIDYPVMYRPDDEGFYLKRNFQRRYDLCGLPYISEKCNLKIGDNWIVYGHHMRNGSMFADLDLYKTEKFYKRHPDIWLTTLEGVMEYRVISAFALSVYTNHDFRYYDFSSAESEDEFNQFIDECKKRQFYNTSETAEYGDHLLILSTCEYTHKNGRMVVVAKKMTV